MILPRTYIMTPERLSCYRKEAVLTKKKQARDLEPRACNFTAIINTNHQRKTFHSKAEIFLYYRRRLLGNVT